MAGDARLQPRPVLPHAATYTCRRTGGRCTAGHRTTGRTMCNWLPSMTSKTMVRSIGFVNRAEHRPIQLQRPVGLVRRRDRRHTALIDTPASVTPDPEHGPIQRPGRVGSRDPGSRRHMAVSMEMPVGLVHPSPTATGFAWGSSPWTRRGQATGAGCPEPEHGPIQRPGRVGSSTPGLDGTWPFRWRCPLGLSTPRPPRLVSLGDRPRGRGVDKPRAPGAPDPEHGPIQRPGRVGSSTPGLDGTWPFRWRCPLGLSTPRPPRLVLLGDRPRGRRVDKPRVPGAPNRTSPYSMAGPSWFRTTSRATAHGRFSRHEKPTPDDTETDARGIDGATVDGVIHALSTVPVPDETRGAVDQGWATPPGDLADGIPRPQRRPPGAPPSVHRPIQRPGRVGSYDSGVSTAHGRFDGDARSACPPLAHRDSVFLGDRPRGRGVDKPPAPGAPETEHRPIHSKVVPPCTGSGIRTTIAPPEVRRVGAGGPQAALPPVRQHVANPG